MREVFAYCRLCGHEVTTDLGPESYLAIRHLLSEHLLRDHTREELASYIAGTTPSAA